MRHEAPTLPALIEDYVRHLETGGGLTPEEFLEEAGVDDLEALESLRLAALLEREAPLGPAPGERLGPYRLERRLGTGGMGTVYLATVVGRAPGVAEGASVALKLVHPHLFQRTGYFSRFLREVEVGRRVKHDNVVRVLAADAIEVAGRTHHVLVMEYVEGRTLRELLRDLGTVPEALLREIALQVTEGLAAVHEAGVVHRDLKPENVLITDDHRVRIMDLGVARVVAETAPLTREGEFIGSLAYAAPEQFQAAEVTAAADLYSLGVLLYELATGSNPFQRDEIPQLMAAHLHETPRRASDLNEDVSPFFAEVLDTLLEKEPHRRFVSSGALGEVLDAAERSPWWAEREAQRRKATHIPRVPVQRQTHLYGRAADLALLRDAWERAGRGEGNTVLLEGEAGIGKTRLVDAFLHEVAERGAHVLYGSYPPAGGMGGLSDAVIEHFGATRLEGALAPYLTVTPSLVPAFAALLAHERPPEGATPLPGAALHAVFVHLLKALAAEKPLVWVVDDLHFASEDSRQVVLSMARAVESQRILLLMTTRPGLPETELAHFSRLVHLRRATLGRLSPRQVIELLRDAFRSEKLAVRLGGEIALKSDGVPFFVFEMIRGLAEGQFITELPDGTWVETKVIERIEVPSAVRDLIEARVRDLSEEQRAILDVGAVQGFAFDPDLVARVVQLPSVKVLRVLAEVERRWGVVRGQAGSCRFDHHQIQEVLYEDLPPDLRAEYHGLVAEALEAREGAGTTDPHEIAPQLVVALCEHFLKGGRGRRAVRYLDAAADRLTSSNSYAKGVTIFRSALGVPGLLSGAERATALHGLWKSLDVLGRRAEAEEIIEEAVRVTAEVDVPRPHAAALLDAGAHYYATGRYANASDVLDEAGPFVERSGDDALRSYLAHMIGLVRNIQGHHDEARTLFEQAAAIDRARGSAGSEAIRLSDIGRSYHDQERPADSLPWYERALALAEQEGDRRQQSIAIGGIANALCKLGHFEDLPAWRERELALCREIAYAQGEAVALNNLGVDLSMLGRYGQAAEYVRQCLSKSREIGSRETELYAHLTLGENRASLGDLGRAEEHLRAAHALATELGIRDLAAYSIKALGGVAEARGDATGAERLYREALDRLRSEANDTDVAETLVDLGGLLADLGRPDEGQPHLGEGLALADHLDAPVEQALATAHLAVLGGDVAAAISTYDRTRARLSVTERLRARYLLWRATDDVTHLADAHRLLELVREHAPEDCRESLVENVPLHRDVAAAWAAHGSEDEPM